MSRMRESGPFKAHGHSYLLTNPQQEYTAVRPDTGSFRQALFHEAHMLFRSEVSNDCITSLSAIGLFGAACIFEGQDTLGMELSVAGRRMAERLGLVGPSAHDTASQMTLDESPKFVRAASHATWGAYNWLTYVRSPRAPAVTKNCFQDACGLLPPRTHTIWPCAADPRGYTGCGITPLSEQAYPHGQDFPETLQALDCCTGDCRRVYHEPGEYGARPRAVSLCRSQVP